MTRIEALVVALGNLTGAFDTPDSKAFQLANPLLLKTYRPEKKCDSDHLRIFSSIGGGIKASVADIQAKASGKSNRLTSENTLRDLFVVYGFSDERIQRKIIVFLQKAVNDPDVYVGTKISWLLETPVEEIECQKT
jgi:hypothetical protein